MHAKRTEDGQSAPIRSTADAAHAKVVNDYRGDYPAAWFAAWEGQAGAADNAVIYTSPDVSGYNVHQVECIAGTVDVDVSLDGVNWIAAVAGVSLVTVAPAARVVEAAAGVSIEIRGKFRRIRVLQKGPTASNARGAHAVA